MRYYCPLLCTHLSFLLFLILYSTDLVTGSSSCPSKCGKISIPYPFGIGKGCYLDEWFEVQCNNSISGKPVPYLPKINKEVVSINLPIGEKYDYDYYYNYHSYSYGSILIKTNITSTGCSNNSKNSSEGKMVGEVLNFTGSPFSIGASNVLLAVGCNNKATLTNLEPRLVGCTSSCYPGRDESRCNGYKCCQADIPVSSSSNNETGDGIQVIGVSIEDIITNQTQTQSCRVAFLTAQFSYYPEEKLTDPQWFHNRKYVTIQLRWIIPNMNESFINSLRCQQRYGASENAGPALLKNDKTCECKQVFWDSSSETVRGSCKCSWGYKGNPYILDGCTDVDECQELTSDGKSVYCNEFETCVNTQGSYHCVNKRIKIIKIAIGLGAGFGVLIFTGITFWLFKFIKRRKEINRKKKYFKRNGGLLLQQQLTSREGIIEKTKVFNSRELEKATENFCSTRVLGQGGQGTVYKGMLVDGSIVAIKKSKVVDEDKLEEFINEVVILSQINHRHIVKLLGCCLETEVPLLVYEFIPNGNLFEHLHDDSDDYMMATWEVRLRIALDIAEALSYLHSAAASPIYHRDIKTTNIMLDEKHRGKVSDFGTSRSVTIDHTHLTTVVSGTVGYLDPEYLQSSQFTDKSDVYSFGVVLVELITGQKPFSFVRSQENRILATYFILAMKDNKLFDTIDPRIRDDCKLEQVVATAQLATRCLDFSGKKRPNMRKVSMELEKIRSPNGNSQSDAQVVEDDENEVAVEIDIGFESYGNIGVTAPSVLQDNAASTSWSDAEPLFPRQTW